MYKRLSILALALVLIISMGTAALGSEVTGSNNITWTIQAQVMSITVDGAAYGTVARGFNEGRRMGVINTSGFAVLVTGVAVTGDTDPMLTVYTDLMVEGVAGGPNDIDPLIPGTGETWLKTRDGESGILTWLTVPGNYNPAGGSFTVTVTVTVTYAP